MRDLIGRFGSVPFPLAAYNAGPGAVAACACIPPYPETRAYVARILGLLGGAAQTGAAPAWTCGSWSRERRRGAGVRTGRRPVARRP
jgi:hypothetical protein